MCLDLLLATSGTPVEGHQLSLFDIKLVCLVDQPFVMTVPTQRLSLVLFLYRGLAKRDNIGHF